MGKGSTHRRIPEKFKKLLALSYRDKLLYSEALLLQFISGLILKLVPFRKITRLFALPSRLTSHISLLKSQEIKQAIIITSRLSPWKNKCFVQALAGRWMLNRRGIDSQLSLGVTIGHDKKMVAHAWLKARDFEIVEKNGDYLELYLF
jgi:hypothetical protein